MGHCGATYKSKIAYQRFTQSVPNRCATAHEFLNGIAPKPKTTPELWMALLVCVLLRFLACVSDWTYSFTRLWALVRTALWKKLDALALLRSYGTAGGSFRMLRQPEAAYLPGFA